MHDVIKRIARPVICRKFWHKKPSWGLIIDNTRAKRRGEHVVQSPTDGAQEGAHLLNFLRLVVVLGVGDCLM